MGREKGCEPNSVKSKSVGISSTPTPTIASAHPIAVVVVSFFPPKEIEEGDNDYGETADEGGLASGGCLETKSLREVTGGIPDTHLKTSSYHLEVL